MTSTENEPSSSYFVSDLHLFARRSTGTLRTREIAECMRKAHTLILGGDIFDFKWSTLGPLESSLDGAIGWLEELLSINRACKVEFILGNHDANNRFTARLQKLSDVHEQFDWHPYFLRQEHCLFLHGDIVDGSLNHEQLDRRRNRFEGHKTPSRHWHYAYDMAVKARVHTLVSAIAVRKQVVARRIATYAEHIGQGPDAGVRDVYFGHTHCEMRDVHFEGLRLHNGGAAIRNCKFRIIETSLEKRLQS